MDKETASKADAFIAEIKSIEPMTIEQRLIAEREHLTAQARRVVAFHDPLREDIPIEHFASIKKFIETLGFEQVMENMEIAIRASENKRLDTDQTYRYFFGCCWRCVRDKNR